MMPDQADERRQRRRRIELLGASRRRALTAGERDELTLLLGGVGNRAGAEDRAYEIGRADALAERRLIIDYELADTALGQLVMLGAPGKSAGACIASLKARYGDRLISARPRKAIWPRCLL